MAERTVSHEVELSVKVEGRNPTFPRGMVRKPGRPIPAGSVVKVKDRDGRLIGQGFYNPRAAMALHMLTWRRDQDVDLDFLTGRLTEAVRLRRQVLRLDEITDAYRLVHGDGDGLPGLVVDRFGPILVVELRTLGMQRFIDGLGRVLKRLVPSKGMLLTVSAKARMREGLEPVPPGPADLEVEVREGKARFRVRPGQGHKTGYFCDQREHRLEVGKRAGGRRVLDVCAYTGGFSVHAALGGARSVTALDLDEELAPVLQANARLNQAKVAFQKADAFEFLREAVQAGKSWDLVVLDPPAFALSREGRGPGLAKYRDLNRLAFQVLAPGGLLLTCSCSGPVEMPAFVKVVQEGAAAFSGLVRILEAGGAGPDHPVHLHCPETRYLKTLWLQKVG